MMAKMTKTQDQLDMDLLADAELARLKRQFRIMEGDRKAYHDEITIKLEKQRKIVERLREQKSNLVDNIAAADCVTQKRRDLKKRAQISSLICRYNSTLRKLQEKQETLHEIEEQIRKTEKQVNELKNRSGGGLEMGERIKSGQMQVKMLENQLQNVVRRFCVVLTQNKERREEIDHLLKERERFNGVWERLVVELNVGKKFMMDLVEQATLAYDQREEWCSKLQALKIRAHNDVIVHTQEMREMQRQLDHDGKLREFLTTKGQKRIMRDLELKEEKRRELENETIEQQQKIYEETMSKIQKFSRESELDRIVAKYLKQEEENFALFNYVNELNHELEQLSENIHEYEEKIKDYVEKSEERAQKQVKTLDSLTHDLNLAVKQQKIDESDYEKTRNELENVLKGINQLFNMLGCDCSPILGLLGEKQQINEDNVGIYMGLVERKVSALITNVYFKEKSLMKKRVK